MTQTVIGLPKKRLRRNKCLPFHKKSSKEIDTLLLEWFVGSEIAAKAVSGDFLITEDLVENKPELVSLACLDHLVNIDLIKKYCDSDAWGSIQNVYSEKRKNPMYICKTCGEDADCQEASVMCNACLEWQHLSCAQLKKKKTHQRQKTGFVKNVNFKFKILIS